MATVCDGSSAESPASCSSPSSQIKHFEEAVEHALAAARYAQQKPSVLGKTVVSGTVPGGGGASAGEHDGSRDRVGDSVDVMCTPTLRPRHVTPSAAEAPTTDRTRVRGVDAEDDHAIEPGGFRASLLVRKSYTILDCAESPLFNANTHIPLLT